MRCPSWSPGNELKCECYEGHTGRCFAKRLGLFSDTITWKYRFHEPEPFKGKVIPLDLTRVPGL